MATIGMETQTDQRILIKMVMRIGPPHLEIQAGIEIITMVHHPQEEDIGQQIFVMHDTIENKSLYI